MGLEIKLQKKDSQLTVDMRVPRDSSPYIWYFLRQNKMQFRDKNATKRNPSGKKQTLDFLVFKGNFVKFSKIWWIRTSKQQSNPLSSRPNKEMNAFFKFKKSLN